MFYQIAIRAVNLLWHFWFKLQIFGRENEPKEGGYILASNHCSAIDPMIVCQGIRRVPIHYMAKAELFDVPVLKHVIRWLNAFPVSPRRGRHERHPKRHPGIDGGQGGAGTVPGGHPLQGRQPAAL